MLPTHKSQHASPAGLAPFYGIFYTRHQNGRVVLCRVFWSLHPVRDPAASAVLVGSSQQSAQCPSPECTPAAGTWHAFPWHCSASLSDGHAACGSALLDVSARTPNLRLIRVCSDLWPPSRCPLLWAAPPAWLPRPACFRPAGPPALGSTTLEDL